ncbi:MAG: eCIS core domain-containing protein [Ktedonobacteraceae bacterium]
MSEQTQAVVKAQSKTAVSSSPQGSALQHVAVNAENSLIEERNPSLNRHFEQDFSKVRINHHVPAIIQTKLTIGQPGDQFEREADSVADTVMRMPASGSMAGQSIGSASVGELRRQAANTGTDQDKDLVNALGAMPGAKPNNYDEAAGKAGEAFMKTDAGKQVAAWASETFLDKPGGKVITGAIATEALAALYGTHSPLPIQPQIPLDFVKPGLSVKFTYEGPVNKPTQVGITFSFGPKKKEDTLSEKNDKYRKETERIRQDLERGRERHKTPQERKEDEEFQRRLLLMQHDPLMKSMQQAPGDGAGMTFGSTDTPVPGSMRLHMPEYHPNLQKEGFNLPKLHLKDEEDATVQRKESSATPSATHTQNVLPIVHDVLHSSGQPLDSGTRAFMEPRFNHDFSGVRVHTDARAAGSARSVNALAYTVGQNVVFGSGQYTPTTMTGKRLLAHELTHVVQQHQNADMTPQAKLRVNEAQDAAEQEADTVANQVGAKEAVHITSHTSILQLQRNGDGKGRGTEESKTPPWTPDQLRAIQVQLKRLGLYRDTIDKRFGGDTESGLVEAFGGDEWRKLDPKEIVGRLSKATPPKGKPKEHNLRYGELFKDGILDITLGVGFDETGWGKIVYDDLRKKLPAEGFEENAAKAKEIYKRTGHTPGASTYGMYFVWKKTLLYKPPAGSERKIEVVVRLVSNPDEKHGAEAAGAFEEGMKHSDVAFYAGHGRFGSGPDFDRAMKVTFLKADGTPEVEVEDYEDVEKELKKEVKSGDTATLWQRFQWRLAHGRIKVEGDNAGNIYLNPTDRHPSEFAARLMYWNLNRRGGVGAPLATGKRGELARPASERSYRLWVFNGCRTQDYLQSVRSTRGADTKSTDILATRRTIYWSDYVNTVVAFMESILAQQSAEQIVKEMDAKDVTQRPKGPGGVAEISSGISDNPVIP